MTQTLQPKQLALEGHGRLSRSIIWKLQRDYFEQQGIAAWSSGKVPHHFTSSPFICDSYARIVFGFLLDCGLVGRQPDNSYLPGLDRSQPVYLVELGSGPGRFGFLFLKKFLSLLRESLLQDICVKYVMTDFAEQTVEYWRAHRSLQPFVAAGLLDFARFDVECDQELKLLHSGARLLPGGLRNPLVVISNYLFDSIPQDAFSVAGGKLFETRVRTTTSRELIEAHDPERLSAFKISYQSHLVNGDYYDDPEWNRILMDYHERLADTAFLFPTAALKSIRNLRSLADGRMMLLSGDRGFCTDAALAQGKGAPAMALHGSFSMMVDYQILGEYCRGQGGSVLHPARPAENLNISAFVFGDLPTEWPETRRAYADAIDKFGPDDFFNLTNGIEQVYEALSLAQILAFLKLSGWDFKRFLTCLPVLKDRVSNSSEMEKLELFEAITKVWDSYLPIGEPCDLAFELGTVLLEMEFYAEALEFLQRSVDLYQMESGTAYNMAVCCYSLKRFDEALAYVNSALELDPEFDAAKALRLELRFSGRPGADNHELAAAADRYEPVGRLHLREIDLEGVKSR